MYYYQRLRDLREDADKTQKEIAELLNTNQSQYQKYESGKRELPLHHAITLSNFYNVSIDYITGITNIKYGKNNMNTEERNLLERWNCLTEKNKGKAEYFFEQLLKKQLRPKGTKSGGIFYKGVEIDDLDDRTAVTDVGFVMQNPDNQIVTDKVWHELAFGLESLGTESDEIRRRVAEICGFFGIGDWYRKRTCELSGGQKQRIAIAGVLAIRPRVLVLDEATSMLDPQGRKDVMDTVKRLNREGITVVAITHFMDEVTEADRVAVLSEGELVMQGAPREIFKEKDKLHGYGLDVPRSVALSHELFSAGLEIEPAIFDVDELGDEICRLLSDN